MKEPIAGVTPPELAEIPSMTVWPSIAATSLGRLVGRLAAVRSGLGWFTLGKLFALLTIPISLALYAWRLMPFVARRYTLTNRRIIIQKGLKPVDDAWIDLEAFDTIDIEVLDGQEWLRAGDLVFRREGEEVFRLPGVLRPQVFREVCRKAHTALVSVHQVLQSQTADSA